MPEHLFTAFTVTSADAQGADWTTHATGVTSVLDSGSVSGTVAGGLLISGTIDDFAEIIPPSAIITKMTATLAWSFTVSSGAVTEVLFLPLGSILSGEAGPPPNATGTAVTESTTFDPDLSNPILLVRLDVSAVEAYTCSFAVTAFSLLVEWTNDTTVGDPIPHLETSEAQAASGPLPSEVTISGALVGDDSDLYPSPTYLWELIGIPIGDPPDASVEIDAPTELETLVTFTVYTAGVYTFRLTATQTDQPTLTATTQVTLPSSSVPRVASETRVTTFPTPVTVEPVVTDDGWNGALTYAWTQVGGPDTATIVSPTALETELQFPEMQGVYSFQLAVSNDVLTGTGIIKVLNYANIGLEIVVGRQLYVTIGGVEYVTDVVE